MLRRRLLASLIASPVLLSAGLSFAAAHGGEEKGAKKKGGGASFVQLPTLTANALRPNGRRGVMTVEAGLDIKDGALRTKAQSSIPRLRAAYTETLQAQAAAIQPGAPPNPDALVVAFQRTTDIVLGRAGARFLIGAVLIN